MRRTRIKICGLMRPQDARMAAACGADAIGMIFHPPSPRNVSIEQARQILAVLPPFVIPVGLFVDETVEQMLRVSNALGLRDIQLHGSESPEIIAQLANLTVIKAVRASHETLADSLDLLRNSANLKGIVLETSGTKEPGGTGVPNDWEFIRASKACGVFDGFSSLIVAGGLNPANVGEVVRSLRPWAVDVSSGVEKVRGEKSEELVRQFISEVDRADRD